MNKYLIFILTIIIFKYLLDLVVDILNVSHIKTELPEEFQGYYDAPEYKRSQNYLREKTCFGIIEDTFFNFVIIIFILTSGFNIIDQFARSFNFGEIFTGLIFVGVLMLALKLLSIPFSAFSTFVIEEKYGFNKTTWKTFIQDIIKSLILTAIIGGIAYSAVVWFFIQAGSLAWVYCWGAITLFELFLVFIAPVVIMPLFNKFVPLEDGQLKEELEDYARRQNFKIKGVFKMDGSKRSTKSNAFFTGFGNFRRIALFDTLIEKHTTEELISILAHEIGHYKKKHIVKGMVLSVITSGFMFFILSKFINNRGLFDAFGMQEVSVYASLVFFSFLYSPINMIFSVIGNVISRKHEYQADKFAVRTYPKPDAFINALKKLTVDNLSNLNPHPAKVFLDYSHPPVLKRIKAIKQLAES